MIHPKTILLQTFCLFSISQATFTHMMQMVKSYQNESDFLGELVRSFHGIDDFYLNSYSRYGCWCYLGLEYNILGMDKLSRSAPPVNEVDGFCHNLHNGYECIDIDSRNTLLSTNDDLNTDEDSLIIKNNNSLSLVPETSFDKNLCHSRTVDYNLPSLNNQIWHDNKKKLVNKLVKEACDLTNFESCASKTCQIELNFVIKMLKWQKNTLLGVEYPELERFQHKSIGGNFDPSSECKINSAENLNSDSHPKSDNFSDFGGNNACCGEFPSSEPYHHIPDKQECCNSVVYNPQYLTCRNSRRLVLAI